MMGQFKEIQPSGDSVMAKAMTYQPVVFAEFYVRAEARTLQTDSLPIFGPEGCTLRTCLYRCPKQGFSGLSRHED